MSLPRFNFNLINQKDLRKFLSLKMESKKWEASSAYDAIISHYSYHNKISYGFPHSQNMKLIIKKILKELDSKFILPFICFTKTDMISVLSNNTNFLEDGFYYFRNIEGKREIYNYQVKSFEHIKKIIENKYKNASDEMKFILEKSIKKPLLFKGNSFEIRAYILIVRIDEKYYTFLYPLLLTQFGINNINLDEFISFLGIGYENSDNINSLHPILKNIYILIQKTANIMSNFIRITKQIYTLENNIKEKNKSELQYNLYALDIIINEENNPYLIDIILNPTFSIIREKTNIYNDIIDNFIIYYNKYEKIDFNNSNFILLTNTPQNIQYKIIICKKEDPNINNYDDSLESITESKNYITTSGEELVQKVLDDNKILLNNDNLFLVNKIELLPNSLDNYESNDRESNDCEFNNINNNDNEINKKIIQLEKNESKKKIIGIATATLPIFALSYIVKKTYSLFSNTKKKN